MPLLRSKFQPYFPDPDSPAYVDCGFDNYCHPVQLGDTIMSQFYQTPCAANEIADPGFEDFTLGSELILNGNFVNASIWTTTAGWTIASGKATKVAGNTNELYQTGIAFTVGEFYQITVDITRTAGSIAIRFGQTIGATSTYYIDATGTYTIILPFNDAGVGDNNIYFVPDVDFAGDIDNVSVKEITFASWNPNASWFIEDNQACHIPSTTGCSRSILFNTGIRIGLCFGNLRCVYCRSDSRYNRI
jgi:hypothetical protein